MRREGDAKGESPVEEGEVAPEDDLHQNRSASEEPDVEPGDGAEHVVLRKPHHCNESTANNTYEHREECQLQSDKQSAKNEPIEQIVADDIPLKIWVPSQRDPEKDHRDQDDYRSGPPAPMADGDGLDHVGSVRVPASPTIVHYRGWRLDSRWHLARGWQLHSRGGVVGHRARAHGRALGARRSVAVLACSSTQSHGTGIRL